MPTGFVERLSPDERELVLRGSTRFSHAAGAVTHGVPEPLAVVIESGLVRIFVGSADGRQASIAYFHSGDFFGTQERVGFRPVVDLQAVTQAAGLLLDAENLIGLAETHPSVNRAVMRAMGEGLTHLVRTVSVRSLGSMKQRLAFDLLDRASESQLRQGELVFAITHEHLADSIGSTREVITRLLGEFRRAGIVATGHGQIRVLDAARLSLEFRGVLMNGEPTTP